MGFQTPQYKLIDLVARARAGEIQLPDFQRGYVWDDERVRQLIVTVANEHPMGVLLLLETGSRNVYFESKPIETTRPPTGFEPELLVLDGQQRLTSLTQALSGSGIVETKDDGHRRYFLRITDALEAESPGDVDAAIVSLPGDGVIRTNFNRDVKLDVSTREKQLEEGYLPVTEIFSDGGASDWMLAWAAQDGGIRYPQVSTFLGRFNEPMRGYALPAIQLEKETSVEAVTTVFEKVNQGGVKLTVFELLTAKFAGDRRHFEEVGHAFRLREHWKKVQKALDEHPVLQGFESDDFLQAVSLVSTIGGRSATTARKDDILRMRLEDFREWAPRVTDALVWAATFLDGEHIHSTRDLPYPKQIVPLAAIRVVLGPDTDAYGIRKKIRQWFWSGILGELYGSAIETRFARDIEQVPAWARGEDGAVTPRTVEDAYFNESRLHTLRTRNSAAYKGIYALMMTHDARDWIYNQPFDKADYLQLNVDIHHIFPKAWCKRNDIAWEDQESIVNKTPLAKRTNIKLSGYAPSVYRKTIVRDSHADASIIDAVIAGHLIDPELLWADDFDGFFDARREALCELIEEALGKPVTRDIFDDEDVEEDVSA